MQTAVETSRRARRARPSTAETALRQPARRVAYLDRLKVLLVAVIIATHGIVGYSGFEGGWPYQPVREVRLAEVSDDLLGTLALPSMLFVMGVFFLISGLVAPGSLARKGTRRFVRDRLVRLGIPLAVWVLGIWPALVYFAQRAEGDASYWTRFWESEPFLDAGPMWFVEVLLLYSLGYAAWERWQRRRPADPPGRTASAGRTLVAIAAGISVATILVRLVFLFDSHQVGELQLWQWPQYLAMFGLGTVAVQRGWLNPVPDQLQRRCGVAALLALAAFLVLLGAVLAGGLEPADAFSDLRLHWAPLMLAALEGPLAVGAGVWVLGAAQRHLNRAPGRRGRAFARSAYAAFILQGAVLIGLAVALRPLGLPAEIKALTVACAGVAASFALAWVLVTRTRLGRML